LLNNCLFYFRYI